MGIFGGRTHAQPTATVAELSRAVPSERPDFHMEAEIISQASDVALKARFASVWSRTYDVPSAPDKRIEAVQTAIVNQEREETADLFKRASLISAMPENDLLTVFGVKSLPAEKAARFDAAIDLAIQDVPGFECQKIASERALSVARGIRSALSLSRDDANRFKDVSPLARLTWKHIPDMASRSGVKISGDEGYRPQDPEFSDAGLAIHNSGADSRAASKMRAGFSQAVNRDLDLLIGPHGANGMVDRMIATMADRERKIGRTGAMPRSVARDMSAAAFLSGLTR